MEPRTEIIWHWIGGTASQQSRLAYMILDRTGNTVEVSRAEYLHLRAKMNHEIEQRKAR